MISILLRRLGVMSDSHSGFDGEGPGSGETRTGSAVPTDDELEQQFPWLRNPLLEQGTFEPELYMGLALQSARTVGRRNQEMFARFFGELDALILAAGETPIAFVLIPDEVQVEDPLWEDMMARAGPDAG